MKNNLAQKLLIPQPKSFSLKKFSKFSFENFSIGSVRPSTVTKKMNDYIIPSLFMTASANKLASLSTRQISIDSSAIVVHKNLIPGKWENYDSTPEDYEAYIGPKLDYKDTKYEDDWESFPHIPGLEAYCRRSLEIGLTYYNRLGEVQKCVKTGFEARVLQHQLSHLKGKTIINCEVSFCRFRSNDPQLKEVIECASKEIVRRNEKLLNLYFSNEKFKKRVDTFGVKRETIFRNLIFTSLLEKAMGFSFEDKLWNEEYQKILENDKDFNSIFQN